MYCDDSLAYIRVIFIRCTNSLQICSLLKELVMALLINDNQE